MLKASSAGLIVLASVLSVPVSAGTDGVGVLTMGGGDICNGTMIAPNAVLTSAHCLIDLQGSAIRPAAVTFRDGAGGRMVARSLHLHPNFSATAGATRRATAADLAVIVLREPVETPAVLHPLADRIRNELQIHARLPGREAPIRNTCPVLRRSGAVLILDCTVQDGMSGAPFFSEGPTGAAIAAVLSARVPGTARVYATRVDLDLPWINEILRHHRTPRAAPVVAAAPLRSGVPRRRPW